MSKVYFLSDTVNIKIGFTRGDVSKRAKQLSTGSPNKIYVLGWMEGNISLEKSLHKKFSGLRIRDNGEWFNVNEDLINYINEHNEKPNTYVDIMDNKIMTFLKV